MGKIRVKSFGDQEEEKKAVRRSEKRAEAKEQKKASKDGEGASEEVQTDVPQGSAAEQTEQPSSAKASEGQRKSKKAKFAKQKENFRSQNYITKAALIDPKVEYTVSEGLKLLGQAHMAKFDETVELHINTTNTGISGQITLPHGSGKAVRVAIVSDAILAEVEKGKINFDILVANPADMPKLAKVAKILGPKGLMPNPKNGTISPEPEKVAKKFEGGAMNFKTEAKAPIIHMIVGKLSFGDEKLSENILEALRAVKKSNIVNITLKSSMSPAIKLKV